MNKSSQIVLVVDDEQHHREMLCAVLRDKGYHCVQASSGPAALQTLDKKRVDLVILDVRMPEMDGLTALQEIKQHTPTLPVIMVTAYAEIPLAVKAMQRGAFNYLEKPVDIEAFCRLANQAIQGTGAAQAQLPGDGSRPDSSEPTEILSVSKAMEAPKELVRIAARTPSPVLITGESGTGKELVAHAIHRLSARSAHPFVAVNCATLTETLLESELFGHEKGAFTGAVARKLGRFERADSGTLFLDEIGEMHPRLQARLLRVLQDGTFERVGGEQTLTVDVRVCAATNRDIETMIQQGEFREDLYFRLNVLEIGLPPLRERLEDIPILCDHLLEKHAAERNLRVSDAVFKAFSQYGWSGNVRELDNVMQRALLFARGREVLPEHLPPSFHSLQSTEDPLQTGVRPGCTLEEVQRDLIEKTLRQQNGNRTHAAKALGMSRRALQLKIKKFGLEEV